MEDQTGENLSNLLRKFLDPAEAEAAREDIRAGERLLRAYPAPAPDRRTILRIKAEIAAAVRRRRLVHRIFRRSLAAAAVIAFAAIGLLDHGPASRTSVYQAAIIPASLWESDNIADDDLDLVYFTSQVRHIEAQLGALEAGEDEPPAGRAVEELETELIQIETEFWKGRY
jgi:hypothetical protein